MSLPTDFKGTALSVCVCPIHRTKLIFQKRDASILQEVIIARCLQQLYIVIK